jgi:hypothetical protein
MTSMGGIDGHYCISQRPWFRHCGARQVDLRQFSLNKLQPDLPRDERRGALKAGEGHFGMLVGGGLVG